VYKPNQASYASHDAIIAGNAALYGGTAGKAFFAGIAAERFAVRNSGATAVCEGVGDHGCEYMTRGTVIVLGQMGSNFAAGMSGGLAYVLDMKEALCNKASVHLEAIVEEEDKTLLKDLVTEHKNLTGSKVAADLLAKWAETLKRFTKVFPKEYKKALLAAKDKKPAEVPAKPAAAAASAPGNDLEDAAGKQSVVASPDKKRGFHEYDRKALPYRDHKDRILDWEEIYASQSKKSQQWHNWMQTQTARCMDCGTPTCHSPNQGGGGCPLGNRIPTWNQLVHEGEWKRALERLLDTNNFPEFTGTTCPAPCEEACVLGINEKPVAIKTTELSIIEYGFSKGWVKPQPPLQRTGRRVAIIGSGPAGLAAAQQLNRAGHLVDVIERADRPGGLLMYGIPSMKLDKIDKVLRRIKLMQQEGITFKCNLEVGKDVTLNELCSKNDAVIMATGATMWRDMRNTENRNLKNIVQAMDFLTDTQKKNLDTEMGMKKADTKTYDVMGKRVVVIGGGDTAVDCVGTAIRLGAKSVLQFSRRDAAPKDRPQHTPWPCWADTFRVDYAHSEGKSHHGRDPREYMVQTKSFRAGSDPSAVGAVVAAKLNPSGKEVGTVEYPAELVILAMGFTGPDSAIDPQNQLARDSHSNFKAQYGEYQAEDSPWSNLYVCGDCRRGASLVVTAIAEGRDCAARVDAQLMGSTNLPRAAPLAANPTFFQMPQKGAEPKGLVKRHLRKHHYDRAEVTAAFERGLLVDNSKPEETEPVPEPAPDTGAASPQAAQAAPAQPALSAPQATDSAAMDSMQGQVKTLSFVIGGLCLLNLGLVAALVRSKK